MKSYSSGQRYTFDLVYINEMQGAFTCSLHCLHSYISILLLGIKALDQCRSIIDMVVVTYVGN